MTQAVQATEASFSLRGVDARDGQTGVGAFTDAPPALPRWMPSLVDRANVLLALKDGWDTYGAPAPTPRTVQNAVQFVEIAASCVRGLRKPGLFPSSDGSISVQWEGSDYFIEVEFRPDRGEIVFRVERGEDDFEEKYNSYNILPIIKYLNRYAVN